MTNYTLTLILSLVLIPGLLFGQSDQKSGSDKKETAPSSSNAGSDSKSDAAEQPFDVADGKLNFVAPGTWKSIKPKFDFYHAEFQIPKVDGDEQNGRITFSQVGGSIDANLDRWIGQFKADSEDGIKKASKTIGGKKVQLLNLTGTFADGGGRAFGPKTERENYKLIGAAIEIEGGGNVYIKAYGPAKTMEANKKHIEKLIANMKVADN